jgi:MFS-type transporter involved in bile tolerance (Atg22 family)
MFIAILVTILLIALWLPSWIALQFVKRLSSGAIIRKAWPVWLAQVCLAVVFIFLADAINLTNPTGYMFGICVGLGVLGVAMLWRPDRFI